MDAILLMIVSAVLHAAWNLAGKRTGGLLFFGAVQCVVAACALPLLFLSPRGAAAMLIDMWPYVIASGGFQVLYIIGLSRAYGAGRMALAYPLIRALPVVLVALLGPVFGRTAPWSVLFGAGIVLVAAGIAALSAREFSRARGGDGMAFAVILAAGGTVGYSLVDYHAARIIAGGGAAEVIQRTGFYFFWAMLAASILILPFMLRAGTVSLPVRTVLLTGLATFTAYALVVYAMTRYENIGGLVALRQLSIPLGVILAALLHNERLNRLETGGIIAICAGIALANM